MFLNATLTDDQYDDTYVDLNGDEGITLSQTDENGSDNIVILSPALISQLLPLIDIWTRSSTPQLLLIPACPCLLAAA